jgi:hypothetical protein
MKRFHVIVTVKYMPLQFDISEVTEDNNLKYKVETPGHDSVIMCFDPEQGGLRITGHSDAFWKEIERELDRQIQFHNL